MQQGTRQHLDRLPAVAHAATILAPGQFGRVPIHVFQREAVMDAAIGARDTREEALDDVFRNPEAMLIGLRVVDAGQRVEAAEFVVGQMLVGIDMGLPGDVGPDHVPGAIGVLARRDAGQRLTGRVAFPDGHDDHALR